MLQILRAILIVFGLSAILICLSIMFAGPSATASSAERVFDLVSGSHAPFSARWPPTMDSELRFYAPFWGAYGCLLIFVGRDLVGRGGLIPWLAAVLFAGGVGRAISYAAVGPPHPCFALLMAIELLTPPVLVLLWRGAPRSRT